jgi:hypothetical protein
LVEQAIAAVLAPDEAHGIDLEHQRRFAAALIRLWVEHQRLAVGELEFVQPVRMLVEQESEVGCGLMGGLRWTEHVLR